LSEEVDGQPWSLLSVPISVRRANQTPLLTERLFLIWRLHTKSRFPSSSTANHSAIPLSLSPALSPPCHRPCRRVQSHLLSRLVLRCQQLDDCARSTMGKTWDLLMHPTELRAAIQYSIWHEPLHPRDPATESDDMQRCYALLKMTSRSFAMVIEELHPELRTPVRLQTPRWIPPSPGSALIRSFGTGGVANAGRSCSFI